MTEPCRWHTVAPYDLAWHEFDDEFVVFNQQTGHTHLLHPGGAAVLQALLDAQNSLDLPDLERRLRAGADGEIALDSLPEILEELSRLGLTIRDRA